MNDKSCAAIRLFSHNYAIMFVQNVFSLLPGALLIVSVDSTRELISGDYWLRVDDNAAIERRFTNTLLQVDLQGQEDIQTVGGSMIVGVLDDKDQPETASKVFEEMARGENFRIESEGDWRMDVNLKGSRRALRGLYSCAMGVVPSQAVQNPTAKDLEDMVVAFVDQ